MDHRLAVLVDDLVGEKLLVLLNGAVLKTTTDQTLDIEQSLSGVDGGLILGSLTNQTLIVGERNVRGSDTVTLIVGDDLNAAVLVDTDTGVGGTKIDTDSRDFFRHLEVN